MRGSRYSGIINISISGRKEKIVGSYSEHRFASMRWTNFIGTAALPMENIVAPSRYTDDLCTTSRALCACCVEAFVEHAFGNVIKYVVSADSSTTNKFLDFRVSVGLSTANIAAHIPNLDISCIRASCRVGSYQIQICTPFGQDKGGDQETGNKLIRPLGSLGSA